MSQGTSMKSNVPARGFAELLSVLRREGGYSSARDFYRAVGARGTFGCTYAQYLNIEAGRSTPKPALVRKLMALLELYPRDKKGREFVTAYFRTLLKDDEFWELSLQALADDPSIPGQNDAPLSQALKTSVELRQVWLSDKQVAAIEGDRTAYWCFAILSNDGRDWGTLELSHLLDRDAKAIQAALRKLKSAALIEAAPDGRFRCFAKGKILAFPRKDLFLPENIDRARRYIEEVAQRRGRFELYQSLTLRASSKRLKQYYPHLAQSVSGATIYSSPEGGEDTGLYVIETMARRLFDF